MKIRNLAILGGLMVAAGMATVACSGDDDDAVTPGKDAGTDTGVVVKLDAAADTGAVSAVPNHLAIRTFVGNVVTKQFANDPALFSYFGPNTQVGHSPTVADIEDCLAYQFGAIVGNGDTYPPTALADGGSPLASNYACRESMSAVHAPLFIPGPIFDQFVSGIVAEGAVEGFTFSTMETQEVLGLKPQIIDADASTADGGILAYGWQNDAGTVTDSGADAGDADAGTTP